MPSRVIALDDLPPGPGLAARARAARYAAIGSAMREAGLCDLLLGHHADDQAETVLMRAQASSGADGLAGMACVAETASYRLVRPLLGVPSAILRGHLRASGLGWAEDPGNLDGVSLRSRLRIGLAGDKRRKERLLEDADRSGHVRARREAEVAQTLARRATLFGEGYALLSRGAVPAASLASLLRSLSGAQYPLPAAAVERLAANPGPATLGGVRILDAGRLGDDLLLVREEAAMQPPIPAVAGCVWDGRFRLDMDAQLPDGAVLGALGNDAARLRHASPLPAVILRTLPAFWVDGTLAAVPHLRLVLERPGGTHSVKLWTLCSGGVRLHPAHPASGAPFAPSGRGRQAGDAERAGAHHVV